MKVMATTARELSNLKPNWDSYGALKISEKAIETCEAISFIPLADGGIDIELNHAGSEISIEIDPEGRVKSGYWEIIYNDERIKGSDNKN